MTWPVHKLLKLKFCPPKTPLSGVQSEQQPSPAVQSPSLYRHNTCTYLVSPSVCNQSPIAVPSPFPRCPSYLPQTLTSCSGLPLPHIGILLTLLRLQLCSGSLQFLPHTHHHHCTDTYLAQPSQWL